MKMIAVIAIICMAVALIAVWGHAPDPAWYDCDLSQCDFCPFPCERHGREKEDPH